MIRRASINLIQPKSLDKVNNSFIIEGWINQCWVNSNLEINDSISLELLDIDGQMLVSKSIKITLPFKSNLISKKRIWFSEVFKLNSIGYHLIKVSQGCITIKLKAYTEKKQELYIPIVIKGFNPNAKTIKKHINIEKRINQYEKDLNKYYKKLNSISEKREAYNNRRNNNLKNSRYPRDIEDEEILDGIFYICESSEDKELIKLQRQYEDALEWDGPILHGEGGRCNGFSFHVWSGDHEKHFHVVHVGRGIDARFSFPEIRLINYKRLGNSIRRKEQNEIRKFFQDAKNFKKLENEFNKRC